MPQKIHTDKHRLLIIEDESSMAKQMKWGLADTWDVMTATTVDQARKLLASGVFPVATLDLGLPPTPDSPREGFRLLEEAASLAARTKMIVITGHGEQEHAMRAVHLGAVDFCPKPLELDLLRIILNRTFRMWELETANENLRRSCACTGLGDMVGGSGVMIRLFELIRQVSATDYPVLIQGESGTGKEMVARAVHRESERRDAPLVIINCGAIPENLLESELFGHEKGSFTGATARKIGRFEQADGGTIFLDEIGDMPKSLQVKLLRFLEEGTIERLGGNTTISLDVRILAATHVNLEEAVKKGDFREDLFYRLAVVPVRLAPLRERKDDVLLLAQHFLEEEVKKLKRGRTRLSPEAAAVLTAHDWPGNVRELRNAVFRAMALNKDGVIGPMDLGIFPGDHADCSAEDGETTLLTIRAAREQGERRAILQAMAITGNNITRAARLLEVSRPTLHDLLSRHGIKS